MTTWEVDVEVAEERTLAETWFSLHHGRDSRTERLNHIRFVLIVVLLLNLVVALAKLTVGVLAGSLSVLADGFHAVFDSSSNILGLIGMAAAKRPPDANHPYGHRRYETIAAMAISFLLLLTVLSIVQQVIERLLAHSHPEASLFAIATEAASIPVNIAITTYERRRGKQLSSQILLADADHTRSDILVSSSVVISLVLVRLGFGFFDAGVALAIAAMIAWIAYGIFKRTSLVLSDSGAVTPLEVEGLALRVQGVRSCHAVRSRGYGEDTFIDLHIEVNPHLSIEKAHEIGDQVTATISDSLGVTDVLVHIEPEGAIDSPLQ